MHGPLDKPDLNFDARFHPVRTQARQSDGFREWGLWYFQLVQLCTQVEQQLSIESGPDLSGKNEIIVFKITHEQRAQPDTLALRICKPTDQKIPRQLALHFEPLP